MAIKIFQLDIKKHLPIVQDIRNNSVRYQYLRQKLASIFHRRRCIVFGSAGTCEPPLIGPDDVVICVNGSAHNAARSGIDVPHATFLVSHLFGRSSVQSRTTYDLLRGRHTKHAFILTGTVSMADCLVSLGEMGLHHAAVDEISGFERAAMVGDIAGVEYGFGKLNQRVSTGIVAVMCAIFGGAREVNLAGFSLTNGHSYTKRLSKRLHVEPDRAFLLSCQDLGLPITTTSAILAQECHLPLIATAG